MVMSLLMLTFYKADDSSSYCRAIYRHISAADIHLRRLYLVYEVCPTRMVSD